MNSDIRQLPTQTPFQLTITGNSVVARRQDGFPRNVRALLTPGDPIILAHRVLGPWEWLYEPMVLYDRSSGTGVTRWNTI